MKQKAQSPSLRGSGRFLAALAAWRAEERGSIPFIAGQWSLPCLLVLLDSKSIRAQSPSLRGSGRFLDALARNRAQEEGSIPFIAGQWSLLPRTTPSSLFGVLLRKRRLPCDHIICTRLPF